MARPRHEQPTPAELEILKILWERGEPASVRDVFEIVNQDAQPRRAYTSVMSLLNVMTDKGLVRRSPFGRAFLYEPVSPREQTLRSMLGETLDRVYNGSASLLVAHLLDQSHPSGEELEADSIAAGRLSAPRLAHTAGRRDRMQALATEAFKSLILQFVWPALLHSLWIGLLAASVVALVLQASSAFHATLDMRSCSPRFVVATLGPAVATSVQHAIASRSETSLENVAVITAVVGAATPSRDEPATSRTPELAHWPETLRENSYAAFAGRNLARLGEELRHVRRLVVAVWLLGVILSGGLLAMGTRAVRRMRHEADPVSEPIRARARALARHSD